MESIEEFHQLNLDQRLLKAIADLNWIKPTDIQQAVIPLVFAKHCIVVHAKTGSGKTAAFAIPVLNDLLQEKQFASCQATSVVILTPTKELCSQVASNIKYLCKYAAKSISSVDISASYDIDQIKPLILENPDIVIGTPSRLMQVLRSGFLSLKHLRCIVVDEADLIFTFGHEAEIRDLRTYLPQKIQAILMSATLDDTSKIIRRYLVKHANWVRVELPDEAFLPGDNQLTQYIISAEDEDKYAILIALFKLRIVRGKTLIFTNSVDRCYKLRLFLDEFGIRAALLNSELPVKSRSHIIDQFNRGLYDYLLATDESQADHNTPSSEVSNKSSKRIRHRDTEYGVSRGIDFQMVSNVINFDFPPTPILYVHRVGRTARADQMGTALSFVSKAEESRLVDVEALLNPSGAAVVKPGVANEKNVASSVFRPYQFRLSEVDGFKYRAADVMRHITRKVVREARLKEIKIELLNSERLKVPQSLKALMPSSFQGRKTSARWKRRNLHTDDKSKTSSIDPKKRLHVKHKQARKRKSQNPLFSFRRKKSKVG
ncbi:putative ATP-dependent RNA helicase DDX56 [Schistosoma japonicum]|nr:putative ATP-dependent RNA helicase DDX56 [Schistosoma japonicum]